MARIRYLKPGFFKDEDIKELPYEARLFYQGLWIQVDREGRGEDRPERLKVEIMPYDEVDAEKIMQLLARPKKSTNRPFIRRYQVRGERYYQIISWHKHQKPHHTEQPSQIPAPPDNALTVEQPLDNRCPPDVLGGNGNGDGNGKGNGEEKTSLLDSICDEGFNIYQLINRFKKEAGWSDDMQLPDEVIVKVCMQYKRDKDKIGRPYPWFIKVLKMETEAYFARKNIEEGKEFKRGSFEGLGDILRRLEKPR